MSVVNGIIIQPPVRISDVQSVVGHTSGDLATLITNGYINRWAKYKPISYQKIGILTNAERKIANHGIYNIPVWLLSVTGSGTVNSMGNFWFGVNMSSTNYPACGDVAEYWAYRKPSGNSNSPYRLADFAESATSTYGYRSDVNPPIGRCSASSITISSQGNLTVNFDYQGSEQKDGYAVPLSELSVENISSIVFGSMYMSVMIHKVNSGTYYVASRDTTWDTDNSTSVTKNVTETIGEALEGNCEVFPFLCTNRYASGGSFEKPGAGDNHICVAMYEKSSVTVSIQYAQIQITNAYGYRWIGTVGEKNKYAYVVLTLYNVENKTRSYTAEIKLYNSNQELQTIPSGTYYTGSIGGGETKRIAFQPYISEVWSGMSGGYFTAEVKFSSADIKNIIFYNDGIWEMTQFLADSSDTPSGIDNL